MDPSAERPAKAQPPRHTLTVIGAEYAGMAREATADLPAWFRPIAMVFIYAYGLLMSALMAPFVLLMTPKLRRYLRLCKAVSRDVETVWREESPEEALHIARRVLAELAAAYPGRVRIPPYGAATSKWALEYIGKMAYSGHVQIDDWHSALEVAEEVLQTAGEDGHWEWTISKAKALRHTGRPAEARRLLWSLLPQKNAGTEARRLLAAWDGQDRVQSP